MLTLWNHLDHLLLLSVSGLNVRHSPLHLIFLSPLPSPFLFIFLYSSSVLIGFIKKEEKKNK